MGLGLISDYNQFSTLSLAVFSKISDAQCGLHSGLIHDHMITNCSLLEQQGPDSFILPVINSLDLHNL